MSQRLFFLCFFGDLDLFRFRPLSSSLDELDLDLRLSRSLERSRRLEEDDFLSLDLLRDLFLSLDRLLDLDERFLDFLELRDDRLLPSSSSSPPEP